jgi:cbb3-type cytochrome oxidase subunit 3
MIRLLWPALIPLCAFILFLYWRKKRLAAGNPVPPIEGARFWTIIASILLVLVSLLVLGLSQERNADNAVYAPAELLDNGELKRGGLQ